MKVEKRSHATDPGYPSRRQFSDYRLLVGVAAIGLGAAVGRGEEPRRPMGDLAVEPRDPKPAAAEVRTVTLGGIRPDPGPTSTSTNRPPASTNQPIPAAKSPRPADHANPANVMRLRGDMPAEPK